MKIALRGGHNFKSKGAVGLIDETTEDRKVKDALKKYLRLAGEQVLDVTPGNMGTSEDLAHGVNKANDWGADLFISVHFNKCYDSYNGAIGSECWTYKEGEASKVAKRIVDKLGDLGFKNRGVKFSTSLYELKKTNMPAIIIEVCFVEATDDVKLYSKHGSDAIGKYIAEGIKGAKIEVEEVIEPQEAPLYRVKVEGKQVGAYKDPKNVIKQLEDNWGSVEKIEIERR